MNLIQTIITKLPTPNSGEGVVITTKVFDNGDNQGPLSKFIMQEITLNSYGNAAHLDLSGSPLTPDVLRQLANEIDSAKSIIVNQ